MKKLMVFALIGVLVYLAFSWKPSTDSIVENMRFGSTPEYKGVKYHTVWSDPELIRGYIRRMDRHYDRSIPILTWNLVLATGEYRDPDIVEVDYRGGGNYFWRSQKRPKGSIIFYHTIPGNKMIQAQLDALLPDQEVELRVKVSTTSEIRGDNDAFVKLMHGNHKFILVEAVKPVEAVGD